MEKHERDGTSNDEAKKRVESKMQAKDTKHVLRIYRQLLLHTFQLEHQRVIHQRAMEDVRELVSEGMVIEQAIKSAAQKHRYFIEGILKSENDYDSDDSDDEDMLYGEEVCRS